MVESAPQDRKRLLPSMAKPSEPAMKAKKPICGEKPPSRAVAICSGIAIAASVSPAIRSPGRLLGRNAASERNTGQLVFFSVFSVIDSGSLRSSKSGNLPISRDRKASGVLRLRQRVLRVRTRAYPACGSVIALRIAASGAVSSNSRLSPCDFSPRSRHSAARSGVTGFGPISL